MSNIPKGYRGDMANGMDPNAVQHLDAVTQKHIERRKDLLGPAYRLFYSDPVEIARGQGAYLYDSQGNEYLDAYNNVVSVGHSHPRVVQAITQQVQTLCTHTRYLQKPLLNYAEQLLNLSLIHI